MIQQWRIDNYLSLEVRGLGNRKVFLFFSLKEEGIEPPRVTQEDQASIALNVIDKAANCAISIDRTVGSKEAYRLRLPRVPLSKSLNKSSITSVASDSKGNGPPLCPRLAAFACNFFNASRRELALAMINTSTVPNGLPTVILNGSFPASGICRIYPALIKAASVVPTQVLGNKTITSPTKNHLH